MAPIRTKIRSLQDHAVPRQTQDKAGTDRATQHQPTFRRPPAMPTVEALAGVLSGATSASAARASAARSTQKHALAGRADLRDGRHRRQARFCGVGWVWHPVELLEGYHAAPRGHAWQARPAVGKDGAPGEPRGRAAPDRRDATRLPACKIISGCMLWIRHHDTGGPSHGRRRHGIAPRRGCTEPA